MELSEKLGLVIPTLNEAGNIAAALHRVRASLDPLGVSYDITVVDDDSCDGTSQVVRELAAQDPRVKMLVRRGERGLAGAVIYGWQHTDAELLAVMDADL
ncbi:MAG: glycosyltransferase, partial [Chlamydiota bacterium]